MYNHICEKGKPRISNNSFNEKETKVRLLKTKAMSKTNKRSWGVCKLQKQK